MSRLAERIENFNKAFDLFVLARNTYVNDKTNDINRLALTQAFEIVFELGWKVIKDYLAVNGINVYLPKEVIKEAFSAEIIKNGYVWLDMLKDRNASSHEYNQDKVNIIIEKISSEYYEELVKFSELIKGFYE